MKWFGNWKGLILCSYVFLGDCLIPDNTLDLEKACHMDEKGTCESIDCRLQQLLEMLKIWNLEKADSD